VISAEASHGERILRDFRAQFREIPGLYLLAVHASLAVAVNAELLHHLRDNFMLELELPERLSVTVANEVALARLLLSPLYREVGDGLWEMESSVRIYLLGELAAIEGGQRLHDVAALLERYTREEAPWQEWPELREAQLVSAWAQLDPQAVDEWLAVGQSSGSPSTDTKWFVAMRRRLDEARTLESQPPAAIGLGASDIQQVVGESVLSLFSGELSANAIRLTTGLLVAPAHVIKQSSDITVSSAGSGRQRSRAKVVAIDEKYDLAFLRTDPIYRESAVAVLDTSSTVAPFSAVYVVGAEASQALRVLETTMRAVAVPLPSPPSIGSDIGMIQTTRTLGAGSLGAALISAQRAGGLLGIHLYASADGTGYFRSASAITEALARTVYPDFLPLGQSLQDAELHLRIARQLLTMGRIEDAVDCVRDTVDVFRRNRMPDAVVAAIAGLAPALAGTGDLEGVIAQLESARAAASDMIDDPLRRAMLDRLPGIVGELAQATIGLGFARKPSAELPQDLVELIGEYREIRKTQPSGSSRTAAMTKVVEAMRALSISYELVARLAVSSEAGERLAAVVVLQASPNATWLAWLGDRLADEKPFVGYQAAIALRNAAEYLPADDLVEIEAAISKARDVVRGQQASDRYRLLSKAAEIVSARVAATDEPTRGDEIALDWKIWENGTTIRVRFLDGTPEVHRSVEALAREWLENANLAFEFLPFPSSGWSDIRVTFGQADDWSYVGTDAARLEQSQPTICIGSGAMPGTIPFRRAVLKAFGHALGLIPEHQSPNAGILWDREAVYRKFTGPPTHWTREQVDVNVLQHFAIQGYRDFDSDSVMLIDVPGELTRDRHAFVGGSSLSISDLGFIAYLYPRSEVALDAPVASRRAAGFETATPKVEVTQAETTITSSDEKSVNLPSEGVETENILDGSDGADPFADFNPTARESGADSYDDERASDYLATCISVAVQWPDAEVRAVDHIPFGEHSSLWVVYINNAGDQPIERVWAFLQGDNDRKAAVSIGTVQSSQRRWYILRSADGVEKSRSMPEAVLEFTSLGRRYRLEAGNLQQVGVSQDSLDKRSLRFSRHESRKVAEGIAVDVARPDAEVRADDQLGVEEQWWVVSVRNTGSRPVMNVITYVVGADSSQHIAIELPPIDPGRRHWWVLRPDSGFSADDPKPFAEVEFSALGRRWHSDGTSLRQVSRRS
jgi:serralysin